MANGWRRFQTCATALALAVVSGLCFSGLASGSAASPGAPVPISPNLLRDNSFCLGCHEPGSHAKGAPTVVLHSDPHQTLTCVDCHGGVRTVPHRPAPGKVDCGRCHSEAARQALIPTKARIAPALNTHARARQKGAIGKPACADCHGAHDVQALSAPGFPLGRSRIVNTCGACHPEQAAEYLDSVHGKALRAGNPDVPTCETCHPEHPAAARLGISQRGVVATCVSCHEDPGLQRHYQIPADRLASYLGSYHGAATQLGYSRTANCASCHGQHHILPSRDPRSTVNPTNLPRTCGRCHPGVNENVTRGKMHVLPTRNSAFLLYYINLGFRWFTFAIIGGLMGHIGLELFGRWRGRGGD